MQIKFSDYLKSLQEIEETLKYNDQILIGKQIAYYRGVDYVTNSVMYVTSDTTPPGIFSSFPSLKT